MSCFFLHLAGQCLPGSSSFDGLEPCETCIRGYYQELYAQETCEKCPGESTTWLRGSRSLQDCGGRKLADLVCLATILPLLCIPNFPPVPVHTDEGTRIKSSMHRKRVKNVLGERTTWLRGSLTLQDCGGKNVRTKNFAKCATKLNAMNAIGGLVPFKAVIAYLTLL